MPSSPIIIIGGGGLRTPTQVGVGYPVSVGDAIENEGSVTREITFINAAMYSEDIFLPAGDKRTFAEAGAITVQP